MLNHYETVFIVTPVLSETQMKEAVDKFRKVILDKGGEVVHEDNWGLRKLAYAIMKKSTGFFYLIDFKAPGVLIQLLETDYKRDERVIRFQTVKMDKYAEEFSEKRRNKQANAEKAKEE